MSSISSVSSNSAWLQMQMKTRASATQQKPTAEDTFSKIDTAKQGYFDIAGLTTAVNSAVSSSQNTKNLSFSTTDIATAFKQIDADGDGKVTQQEFTSTLSQLKGKGHHHHHEASASSEGNPTDTQATQAMGAMGSMQGMPPPPPPSDSAQGSNGADEGFTSDELKAQLDEIGESDAKRSTLINNVLNNFSKADVDGNGKVSFAEAMQLEKGLSTANSSSAASTATTNSTQQASTLSADQIQQKLMRQLMKMMEAYGVNTSATSTDTTSQLSVTA